jgi:hypothetical protein
MLDEGRFFMSASDLYRRIGTAAAPLIVGMRRSAAQSGLNGKKRS